MFKTYDPDKCSGCEQQGTKYMAEARGVRNGARDGP